MNSRIILSLVAIATMSGCSMMGSKNSVDRPNGPETDPYMVQELTTKFNNDGVTVKSECLKRKLTLGCKELSIKSITAVVSVNSNGGTDALAVAAKEAVRTIVKNIEKGEDTINNVIKGSVEITEEEALGDTSTRVNSNDMERVVTTTATAFSKRRLVGVSFEHKKIDDQIMRTTATWSRQQQELVEKLSHN